MDSFAPMKLIWWPDEFSALYVVLIVFLTAVVIQLYYQLIFSRTGRYRGGKLTDATIPVSVVICAKNEEDNLRAFLPLILEQDYPLFEVVVVNDYSFDETELLLAEFKTKYNHLKVVNIREEGSHQLGKKYALTMGLKGAQHEYVLLTDADCKPATNQWIRSMAANFTPNTEIVLGYGAYEKKKGFLNKLIRFDTFKIALQYFSFALDKMPYMGVGRNLAYKKDLFFRNKGFGKHYKIPSGDDDLFINRVAGWHYTAVEMRPDSQTISLPREKFGAWWRQKKRHLTTGGHYRLNHKLHLGLLFLSNWLFYVTFFVLIGFSYIPILVIACFLLKFTVEMLNFRSSMRKLGESDLLFWAPLLDLFLIMMYPVLGLTSRFSKTRKWS